MMVSTLLYENVSFLLLIVCFVTCKCIFKILPKLKLHVLGPEVAHVAGNLLPQVAHVARDTLATGYPCGWVTHGRRLPTKLVGKPTILFSIP